MNLYFCSSFFFNDTATTEIYTLSLHDALPISQKNNIVIIEDACEALGSEYKGRKVGTFGDASVFAFYPNKQITTGEGGMIVSNKKEWDLLFRSLRNQGGDEFNSWLNHNRLGYNYRLNEMSAALGISQMNRIEEILSKREQIAHWYNERLKLIDFIKTPFIHPNTTRMSWFVYIIKVIPPANRDKLMVDLLKFDIPSRPYFTPIHLQSFYQKLLGYKKGIFPITERLGEICLALPFSSTMSEDEVDFICKTLKNILSKF